MADVNSNININFNTDAALAQLRQLQAGLSRFHQSLAEGNLAAANAQKGLNAQLLQSVGATGKFAASQVKVAGSTLAFTSALEKNKLSLREYFRYTMAAATANTRVLGKAFAQEREIINRARRDRVKALQAQYVQMNKSNAGFMDAIRIMPKTLAMANGKFTELGTRIQYAAQRQQFLNQLLKQGSTQLLNFGKNTQWAGRQLMVGLTMPLALFGSAAAKTFRELEKEIVKFKRVYGDAFTNDVEVNAAVENIRKLANEYTKYGVSVTKTMEMAGTAAAAGFAGGALNAQVETATKLAVLGQIEQQQALETTISLQNAFGISSEELAKKIDFLNAVENQTVLSIEDLTVAIPKAAPVVKQLGGNVEDLAFFLTAMKEGGINASEGANALKSGLASLINPSDKAAKFLGNLGINIKGLVEANKGDIKGTVVGFARALDELDPLNRARAIEQLFGKFQFARLSTLFQNVTKDGSQAARAFDLAGKSVEELAILSEREMKKIEDSVGVKFQAAVEQFKQDIMPIGKVFLEALTPVVKFFGNLFEKFNGLSDQTKKVIAVIVGVVAGLGPVVLMTFGLLMNLVANGIKLFAKLRGGIARLNGQTSVLGAGFNYMTQEQIENAASSQQLHQTHTKLIEVFNVEATSVNALASSYNSLSTQMRAMASQNPALFAGGLGGAKAATSKLPPVRKFKDGILSVPGPKGAGDIQPAMLAPGEAVIPAKTTEKYRGLISAIFNDKVPGFMAGRMPKGVAKAKPVIAHPETQSGSTFVGMPKSAADAAQSRQILDKISGTVKSGRFGSVPPTDFGTLLQPFSGRSFPARGVGGVYRKPNGELVVVKPTIDERTALAEVRATQIAREVHGLVSPKQTIRTMIDPTDPARQRKFIVVESPYDPRIAAMGGKFSKSDMIKQLVASTLRGDKDLARGNLSGNVLADVGTAGVFDRASGFRDFAKAMPSMEQQAVVNLLGVKGGAKKFFAQETSALAAGMTPQQYDAAIKAEISKSIPRLEKVMKSWDLDPTEKLVYGDMLKRLKAGQKTDWSKLQPIHARAGEGIAKFITGVNPDAPKSVVEQQLAKYSLPEGTQAGSLVDDLKRNAQAELIKSLEKLDPARRAVVEAAWKGGKVAVPPSGKERAFNTPRQTAFLNEISSMVPVRVGNEIRYVHKDDYPAFKADPDGRAKYARSSQQVIDNMLYRMGATRRGDSFVAGGKFTGRFAGIDHFRTDLRSTGKTAGGGRSTLSSVVRSVADQQKAEFNARVGNPLRTKTGKAMLAAGFTPDQVRYFLRPELSHIVPTESLGIGGRQGDLKMKTGEAQFDTRLVNTFMNAKKRSSNILKWNSKGNPLGLTSQEIKQYQKAADFMSRGLHPATAEQRALIAKAAELDQRVFGFTQRGGQAPSSILPKDIRLSQALTTVLSDKAFRPSRIMNLAATDPNQVLVKPGEFRFDKNARTLTELTTGNTGPRPVGTAASTGKQSDRRTSTEGPGQTTVTKAQAARIAAAGGVRVIRGRDAGDPDAKLTPYQRQELKKISTKYPEMSESQLKDILRRKLKHEQDIEKAKAKEAAAAKKTAKRAELLPKQMAAAERVEKERQSRLLEASKYQDKANKMNEKMDRKKATQQAKMLRQEKVGRVSGAASMALGTAGMGMMMAGNQGAGMALMGASAVAGMAPMLAGMGAIGWMTTAALAVGASLLLLEKANKNAAQKASRLADETSATTEKMKSIGALTGKVGASEIYDRKRRESGLNKYSKGFERGSQQFGTTFLESETGKSIVQSFTKDLASGGENATKKMAIQLSAYVSDGIMTAEDAHSVASQIGMNLNNQTLITRISGQLLDLIGPNGEDLLKDPLNVRMNLVQEQINTTNLASDQIASAGVPIFDPTNVNDDILEGASNFFDDYIALFSETPAEKIGASLGASFANSLEFNQAQMDSFAKYYDDQILILEKQKLQTSELAKQKIITDKITKLEETRNDGLDQFRANNKQILDNAGKAVGSLQSSSPGTKALKTASETQLLDKYKGTSEELFSVVLAEKTKQLDLDLQVKVNAIAGSGIIGPEALNSMIDMFGTDSAGQTAMRTQLEVAVTKQDPGKVENLLQSLGTFKNKDISKDVFVKLINEDPKTFESLASTINLMQEMDGKEINLEAFFDSKDSLARLKALQDKLDKVQEIDSPITKSIIADINLDDNTTTNDMEGLLEIWDKYENLPDVTKKTIISSYITLMETLTEGDIDAEIARRVAAAGPGGGYAAQYYRTPAGRDDAKQGLAQDRLMNKVKQDLLSKKALGLNDPGNGGAKDNPLAFLDSLAMGLKQVRDNAFNALTPVESLLAAFTNKKTQKDAFNLFDGIQNRLLKLNVGEDLRGAIESMSAEDFDKIAKLEGKKALFTFAKGKPKSKATITGLTQTGKAVDQGYKEKALGNFNFVNEETVKNIQDQTKAYNILISSGLTAAQALDVVASQGQAAAIASGAIKKGDPDWKNYINNIRTANTDLERQEVLNKAIRENEEFKIYKEMPKLASQMKAIGYSTEQIDAVLGDPQLAKFLVEDLRDGKLDSADIAETLSNIEAKKIIDIQVQLNKGNLKEAAELGRQIVDEMFAAEEGLIRTGTEALQIKTNDAEISKLEAQIDPFTRQIEKATEDVNDLNRQLETNPLFGDRAIQKIEDDNNSLSNDLTVISNAAEEVNKKYDDQAEALSKIQEINSNILDQQKRQLDLADALTSGDISAAARAVQEMRAANAARFASAQSDALQRARENELASLTGPNSGLTQEQITKKQYENSQKIYAMERNPARLAILTSIQSKQDEIYNLEENKIEPLQSQIDKLVDQNKLYQASIDKQIAGLKVFGETRDQWDSVNARIDYYAAAQLALNNPEALAGLVEAAGKVDKVWANIIGKIDEYKKGIPDSVKTSQGLIKQGEDQTNADLAKIAKEREDKEEADRKVAALALALRKLSVGATLTDEEKALVAESNKNTGISARGAGRFGAVKMLASGGKVRGAGTSTSDSIPAMLSNGEYVVNADSVSKYGVSTFDSLNAQRLHTGGPVGHRHGRRAESTSSGRGNRDYFIRPESDNKGTGPFSGKGDRDTFTKEGKYNSWLARYARSRAETDKETQAILDKSRLTSWMSADPLGFTGLLKTMTGQGTTTDKFNGALFPLNFLGMGKIAGEGATMGSPIIKESSGILSKITKPLKAAGSKIAAPFKELFLPAANPMFNMKNSFIKGFQTGQSRMGFVTDTKLIKKTEAITKPLISKLDEAGFERTGTGSDNWFRKGTGNQAPRPGNQIEPGDPLWETVLAISKAEVAGMNTQRQAKNVGYYASIAGSFVKKVKDKVVDTVPGLQTLIDSRLKLPGQIPQKALKVGEMLGQGERGINSTFRAVLDGVPGFYKTGIDFAEVKRELFGSLFARASKLIAPANIPVVSTGHLLADGIFSPDVSAQGASILRTLTELDEYGYTKPFNKTAEAALAASSGYRSAIMSAMRFVDSHDGNLTLNPETLVPGLIDFGRVLDWSPFTPTVDGLASEMAAPLFGTGIDSWKYPELTSAFFSGIDSGVDFLATMKASDIEKMLKAAGYKGEELKKNLDLILESIKTTIQAVPRIKEDIAVKQNSWIAPRSDMPPIPGTPKSPAATSTVLTIPQLPTPNNPLKTAALTAFGVAAGSSGILVADPDLSSLKITQSPQPRRASGGRGSMLALSRGGLVPNYFAAGGYAIGTDTVPAMLTPGEFVMSKYAVDKYGIDNMKSINSGSSVGDSVYNYNLNLNVKSDANPDEIARAVMVQIKSVDAQRIRGTRI